MCTSADRGQEACRVILVDYRAEERECGATLSLYSRKGIACRFSDINRLATTGQKRF